jgi:hypothetical protein
MSVDISMVSALFELVAQVQIPTGKYKNDQVTLYKQWVVL